MPTAESRRILSETTLSRQPENTQPAVFDLHGGYKIQKRREKGLERLSSGEASVYIVPPFDLLAFAQLPAEQHDAAIAQGGKVYQPATVIFDLNAERVQLARERGKPQQQFNVSLAARHPAAAQLFGGMPRGLAVGEQTPVRALDRDDYPAHGRQQCIRFFNAEEFHKVRSQESEEKERRRIKSDRSLSSGFWLLFFTGHL
jgi:hypothetical protein